MVCKETNDMVSQLLARVLDLREVIQSSPLPLGEYEKNLDKIDDQVYLLQCEIEKLNKAAQKAQNVNGSATNVTNEQSNTCNATSIDNGETKIDNFTITSDMKEGMRDSARVVGEVVKDGKEVVDEFAGALGDIKDVFSFGGKSYGGTRYRR